MTQAPSDPADDLTPSRRPRGRPKLLTHDRILQVTLAMLSEKGLPSFTMSRLAQRLGTSAMTLYTYFPSRQALLDAAAERIFGGFSPPARDLPWQVAIETWLRSLETLIAEFPVGLKLIKWDGAIAPAWLTVWMPLLHILARAGLEGRDLLVAASWVSRVGLSLLIAKIAEDEEIAAIKQTVSRELTLAAEDRALLTSLTDQAGQQRTATLFEFGVANIVESLGKLVPADAIPQKKR